MNNLEPLSNELLEEYKLCQQKAKDLENNVWKTAGILGVGSVTGIIALNNSTHFLTILLSLFAIAIILIWKRLVLRWLSIQQVLLRRMQKIEKQSQLKTNLYVSLCDHITKTKCKEKQKEESQTIERDNHVIDSDVLEELNTHHHDILEEFKTFDKRGYQWRGIQPIIQFFIIINIATWITFIFLRSTQFILKITIKLNSPTKLKLIILFIYFLFFVGSFFYYFQMKE